MATCKYTFHGKTYDGYEDLIDAVKKNPIMRSQLVDTVMSYDLDRQNAVSKLINDVKKSSTTVKLGRKSVAEHTPDEETKSGYITPQGLINMPFFTINDERPTPVLDAEEYVKRKVRADIIAGMSEEKAEAGGAKILEKWERISEDAYNFHKELHKPHIRNERSKVDVDALTDNVKGSIFEGKEQVLAKAIDDIGSSVAMKLAPIKTGAPGEETKVTRFQNVSFEADLENAPDEYKKIVCHIDYLGVREDGWIDVFNVKSSLEPFSKWSMEKKDNYRYEMALVKRILGANGIDTSKILYRIIPVQIVYDENYEHIDDIWVSKDTIDLGAYGGRSIMEKYDKIASNFIFTKTSPVILNFAGLETATQTLNTIFGSDDIRAQYIRIDAEKWVDMNWDHLNPKKQEDGGFVLTMYDGTKLKVADTHFRSKNKEVVDWVIKNMDKDIESFTGVESAQKFIREIEDSFQRYGGLHIETLSANREYAMEVLSPYFENVEKKTDDEGRKHYNYEWEMDDSEVLKAANMILMKNKRTHQTDIILVTQNDPGASHEITPGVVHILGRWLKKNQNDEQFTMPATWGNIEFVRVLSVIDAMAKDFSGDFKFGKCRILSLSEKNTMRGDFADFRYLFEQWGKIVKIVNDSSGGKAGLKNNIREAHMNVYSSEEALVDEFNFTLNTAPKNNVDITEIKNFKDLFNGYKNENGEFVPGIIDEQREHVKVKLLQDLMRDIKRITDSSGILDLRKPEEAVKATKNLDSKYGYLARIYVAAANLLTMYENAYVPDVGKLSWLEEHLPRPDTISEQNFAKAVSMVMNTISIVNNRMSDYYIYDAKKFFDQFYSSKGFGKTRKLVLGDQAKIYENLFVRDEKGRNTFIFKNPYDMTTTLDSNERKFLKDVLYEFYKCRCRVLQKPLDISGPEDKTLYSKMPSNYLDVPLQKAAKETRYAHLDKVIKKFAERVRRGVTHPYETLKEILDAITDTTIADEARESFDSMTVRNKYRYYENDINNRRTLIDERGEDYFETNIENIFIDYLFAQTRCEEMNNLLLKISGVEIALMMRGVDYNKSDKTVDRIIKAIDDYVLVNVHNGSIMDKQSLYLENCMKGLRKLTTEILFGNNLYGFVRDYIYGLESNFISSCIKFNTDISPKNLSKAYVFVFEDAMKSLSDMSLLRQLNIRYGFSSFDYGEVSRKLKNDSGWLFGWNKWMYWTMKAPDFINRMVLFVGRLIQDGSVGAYTLDTDGNVKYDWRKDERFSALARKDRSDPKYNKQLSRFLSLAMELNNEFPEYNLVCNDMDNLPDLPDGYTTKEIRAIKKLGEQLYGAYDKASRNKLEHMAIGHNFMFFFNFFNGITDIYFGKSRVSDKTLVYKQMTNENGEKLYFAADGTLTTEETDVPAMENASGMEVGIFTMLAEAWKFIKNNEGGVKAYYEEVLKGNETLMKNYKKLLVDMSVTAIFAGLMAMLVKPAYRKRKEEADPEQLVQNIAVELLYRGWARSSDFFSGPLALLKYFGDSTNPVTYDMATKMLTDTYKLLSGKISFGPTMLSYSALYRSMQDSLKMFYKDMAENNVTLSIAKEKKEEKKLKKESN